MVFNFELVEETVEPHFMHDNKGRVDKRLIELEVGAGCEYLERKSRNTTTWTFEPAFNDCRKESSIIARLKKAFKQNNVKCLSITKHYDEFGC